MKDRRVVITGTGIISCVGNNVDTFWDSIVNGKCGLGQITSFDATNYKTRIAGEIKDFDITQYISIKEARRIDKFCHFAIAAGDEAMKQANIPMNIAESDIDENRVGVIVGSGIGGLNTTEEQCLKIHNVSPSKASPLLIPKLIVDMAAGAISMRYGAKGPNLAVVTACATATHSIGEAFWTIKRDDADIMLAGGAEAAITPVGIAGFASMKAMSTKNDDPKHSSRPFDANRDGFVMSEGSGILVLEEYEHAKNRGANILGEVVGYGATGDAYHITSPAPNGEGATRAINIALKHAGVTPNEVDYINAHGTSTPLNDKFETQAIKAAFGEYASSVSISSTKGTTGHGLGATGAFETIACLKAINEGIIPPTINYETPDVECDLDYTPNVAKKKDVNIAININLGFGGHNAVVVIKKLNK